MDFIKLPESYMEALRKTALYEAILGNDSSLLQKLLDKQQTRQVIICQSRDCDVKLDVNFLSERLRITGHSEDFLDILPWDNYFIFVLHGDFAIERFQENALRSFQDDPFSTFPHPYMNSLIFCCGRLANSVHELKASYQDACVLMEQSFFCDSRHSVLRIEDIADRSQNPSVLNLVLLEQYTDRLLQYIQSFNRTLTAEALQELQVLIQKGNESTNDIKLFFSDLYLRIREQMRYQYHGYTIPFYSNTHILRTIFSTQHLEEIILFLSQRIDMIMSSIGASSRESILDDILHYIQHNFTSNITLENIAPLFGYNHSYLGKIFRKKMDISFNEYVDHLRIERAKELLLMDNAKVYAVSEQVGYKNVDYFHVKFRKYVQMSPVEFRKSNKQTSTDRV